RRTGRTRDRSGRSRICRASSIASSAAAPPLPHHRPASPDRRFAMDTPTFAWKLFDLLSPVLLAGIAWLAIEAAQLSAAQTRTEHVSRVLRLVDDAVLVAAREAQQVVVDQLKATSREGNLTPEQRAQAKQT